MNKKGMTFVELVVAMAVTLILVAAMGAAFYPIIKIFGTQQIQSNIKDIANQTISVFKYEMRDAQSVKLSNSVDNSMICYFVKDNIVQSNKDDKSLLNVLPSTDTSEKYELTLSFEAIDPSTKSVRLYLSVIERETGKVYKEYTGSASTLNPEAPFADLDSANPTYPKASHLCIKK